MTHHELITIAPARVCVLAAILSTSCAPSGTDPATAIAAVRAADSAWSAAAGAGDLDASAGAIAADGIMFPPGAPPLIGRAAARRFMQESMAIPGFSASWETDTVVVAASGDLAYAIGRSRYTFPDSAGGLDTMYAKAVSVWRLDPDGAWRAVLDIWNEAPALPPILPAPATE
jgi:ketosteroid isomerase-like protein